MNDLHITIAGTPSNDISRLMANENPLLKVGLLYADKVTLSSMSSALFVDYAKMYVFDNMQKVQFLKDNVYSFSKNDLEITENNAKLDYYSYLLTKKRLTPKEKMDKLQSQKDLNKKWFKIREQVASLVISSGMDNFFPFLEEGILELQSFTPKENNIDSLMEEWIKSIDATLDNPNTYPLFDKTITSLVGKAQDVFHSIGQRDEKHISERATHAGFVSDVYQRLPNFEQASFDEIFDIRKELIKPLKNFRSAMLSYSQEINAVPWEESFQYEAQKLYLMKVVPAVEEVEEACKENKMLAKVINRVVSDNITRFSGLGLGVASMTDLAILTEAVYASAIPVGMAARNGYVEWKEENKRVRNMKMYYYNAVSKRIK